MAKKFKRPERRAVRPDLQVDFCELVSISLQ